MAISGPTKDETQTQPDTEAPCQEIVWRHR